jgi:hypothetical protein
VVDQNSKTVRIYDRYALRWNDDAIIWSFQGKVTFGIRIWADRKTQARGMFALVCASGGAAGIVEIKRGRHTDSDDDLIWQAYPDDNPHSIERIPRNGSILTASSKGDKNLQLYSPKGRIDDFDGYEKVNSWTFDGAHGILWDPQGTNEVSAGVLWVLGDGKLVGYKVKGSGQDTDLDVWREVVIDHPGHKMGHDLQPDYAEPGHLLLTDSEGVYRYDVSKDKSSASRTITGSSPSPDTRPRRSTSGSSARRIPKRRRENALVDEGWVVLRLEWKHLVYPADVRRRLLAMMDRSRILHGQVQVT